MISVVIPTYNRKQLLLRAVASVLDAGYRTGDIMSPGKTQVGCQKMGDLIVAAL